MRQFLVAIPFLLLACNDNTQSKLVPSVDTSQTFAQSNIANTSKNIWIDKLNGTHYSLPDSIGGKPVSFYLDNAKVASIAKALYRGKFRPTDNDSTTELL